MKSFVVFAVAGWLAIALPGAPARAAGGPVAPCGDAAAVPPPGPLGAAPAVTVYTARQLAGWTPPACSGWVGADARSLVVISGRIRMPGGTDGVLTRFGAVSRTAGVRFWAVANQRWETMILDAHALAAPGSTQPRGDFTAAEMASRQPLAFVQDNNDSGDISFILRVREATPGSIVITTDNTTTIRRFLIPLFGAGELETLYVLHAEGGDVWSFYAVTRVRAGANGLTDGHESAIVNRGIAIYRHMGDIPTDQEPPAMR